MIENIIFTTNAVAPVFLMILLGYLLKRIVVINENFVEITSKFVFSVSLPAFIFMKISALDLTAVLDMGQVLFIYAGTLFVYLTIWIISAFFIKDGRDLSVFVLSCSSCFL